MWEISKEDFYLALNRLRGEIAHDRNDILGALALLSAQQRRIENALTLLLAGESKIYKKLVAIESRLSGAAVDFQITQQGESMGTINGTPLGGTSVFAAAPLQASGAAGTLQAGNVPQWSSTDSNVQIAQSADGSQATVTLNAVETNSTYPLTVSGVNSDGNAISTTFSIPVLAAVPPPPPDTAATQFGLTQLS